MIVLRYPPPRTCPGCAQVAALFASVAGWRCWGCLAPAERIGPRPAVSARDARDLAEIRRRLGVTPRRPRGRRRAGPRPAPPVEVSALRHVGGWAAIRSRAGA